MPDGAARVVELALKGLLRYLALEVPRVHDLAASLRQPRERLPPAVGGHLDRLISISRRLSEERELSFYGDETLEVSPEELYTKQDEEAALADAWADCLLMRGWPNDVDVRPRRAGLRGEDYGDSTKKTSGSEIHVAGLPDLAG